MAEWCDKPCHAREILDDWTGGRKYPCDKLFLSTIFLFARISREYGLGCSENPSGRGKEGWRNQIMIAFLELQCKRKD
jgi:hypothetical protein